MTIVARYANHLPIAVVIVMMFAFANTANTADINPLRPVDTSSPRATLQGFVEIMDETYSGMGGSPQILCRVRSSLSQPGGIQAPHPDSF